MTLEPDVDIIEKKGPVFMTSAMKATQKLRQKLREKKTTALLSRYILKDWNPVDVKAC